MFLEFMAERQAVETTLPAHRFLSPEEGEFWLGCGEQHLVIPTEEAEEANRRVEFLLFLHPPETVSCDSYDTTWAKTCVEAELITVEIRILNEYGEPLIIEFELDTPEGDTIRDVTDADGRWRSNPDSMPTGRYVLRIGPEDFQKASKQLNRSDNRIEVQFLNPHRWFIPQQHPDIPQFTFGNRVMPLIDGANAFAAMFIAFRNTDEEGYIYITGWDVDPSIHLLSTADAARIGLTRADVELRQVLEQAAARGVDTRALVWWLNAQRRNLNMTGVNVFTDNKTRGATGSHHQKTAIVRTTEGLMSFVGGIDLTRDRWDTRRHCYPDPDADYEGAGQPWHDVHAMVRGTGSRRY